MNRLIRETTWIAILTFVLSHWAFAEPSLEDMNISKPPPLPKVRENEKDEVVYRYRQSMSPRIGVVIDPKDAQDGKSVPISMGFAFMLLSENSTHWEISADAFTSGEGQLEVSRRFIFDEMLSLRPYYRYGAFLRMKPQNQLASFAEFKKYGGAIAVGLEDLVLKPASIRIELELGAGAEHQFAMVTLGYSWGW